MYVLDVKSLHSKALRKEEFCQIFQQDWCFWYEMLFLVVKLTLFNNIGVNFNLLKVQSLQLCHHIIGNVPLPEILKQAFSFYTYGIGIPWPSEPV